MAQPCSFVRGGGGVYFIDFRSCVGRQCLDRMLETNGTVTLVGMRCLAMHILMHIALLKTHH